MEIPGGRPGAWWALDACLDTAPYGDETAWSSGHSGSSRAAVGSVSRAAHLVRLLDAAELPEAEGGSEFPLPPKLSVTAFHGGQGFSVTPDRCELNVDVRTTPAFDAHDAEMLVRKAVAELDAELPAPKPTAINPVATWPPFRLTENEQPAAALLGAAAEAGLTVRAKTAGPSNIGNLLAGEGIPATAGFGLPYEGLHGIDERAHLAELPTVYAVYRRAVLGLLRAR
ncbi:peptidase dimerization domain-containing protein [Streptomyces sp. NPDC059743]|uniref:peptidase dimerization domain-containing protein n=1 Tax=Streptomyces sp. NPDC059743 TaxID=3346928 RepID=UPI00365E9745